MQEFCPRHGMLYRHEPAGNMQQRVLRAKACPLHSDGVFVAIQHQGRPDINALWDCDMFRQRRLRLGSCVSQGEHGKRDKAAEPGQRPVRGLQQRIEIRNR